MGTQTAATEEREAGNKLLDPGLPVFTALTAPGLTASESIPVNIYNPNSINQEIYTTTFNNTFYNYPDSI